MPSAPATFEALLVTSLPVLALVAKATALLLVAALTARALRRASAAARHLAWTLGVATVLALPLASSVLPAWRVIVPIEQQDVVHANARMPASAVAEPHASVIGGPTNRELGIAPTPLARPGAARRFLLAALARLPLTLGLALATGWAVGSAAALARLGAATFKAHALVRHGRAVNAAEREVAQLAAGLRISRRVRLVASEGVAVPMTFGAWRPVILVPEGFAAWDEGRRHAVILHELAHVQRHDWLVLCLAQLASVALWFHPLVRLAERRIRAEAEQAADDLVLAQGTRPSSYAAHLVGLVRSLHSHPGSNAMTVSMIGGPFDGRIRAILDGARPRGPVSSRLGLLVALTAAVSLLVCSAVDVSAGPAKRSAWKDAKDQVADAVGLGPKDADDWYSRGMELHYDGEYARAIEAFQKSIEMGRDAGAPTYNIACGHARLGHVDEAFAWLDKAVAAGFDVSDYVHQDDDLASLRNDARFAALAARTVDRDEVTQLEGRLAALEDSGSQDAGDWSSLGLKLHGAGEHARAAEAFARAAQLEPGSANVLYNLACARSLAGDRDEALDALAQAVEAGYGDADNAASDTDLDPIRGDQRFAATVRGMETLKLPPIGSFMGIGATPETWEAAAKGYRAWLKDHPDSGRAWFDLGFASLRTGDPKGAAASFHKAYDLGHRRGITAYDVACAHALAGNRDLAFQWLDKAADEGFDVGSRAGGDEDLASLRGDARLAAYAGAKKADKRKFWMF